MNSSDPDPEVEHSARPNVAVQKVGLLARIATFLFGNDAFISYSRSDAAPYALALASEKEHFGGLEHNLLNLRACLVANRSLTSNERAEYSVELQNNDLCKN